jgi:altronate dehydratase small subunit
MKVLKLNSKDNVAVALQTLNAGDIASIILEDNIVSEIKTQKEILFGHKVAVNQIESGQEVLKYGEVIGVATCSINKGDHVHVHNVKSIRGSSSRDQVGSS